MNKTLITAEPGVPQIIITRDFDAPRDLVSGRTPTRACWCSGWARAT